MRLVRLIYASRFTRGVGPNDVQDILTTSRQHNETVGITGVLCYDPTFFLQCLEGERDAVNKLYAHILTDERHHDVLLLEYSEISMRLFSNWSMAYVRISDMTKPILIKYGANATFDPYAMTGSQCVAFVQEIAHERRKYLESERQKVTAETQ